MANLTKRELVIRISNDTGLVQSQVFDVIQKTLDHITESLAQGADVELRNFGVFEVRLAKPRVGRNPNDPGMLYDIPERTTVKFKMGKIMRQNVARATAILRRDGEKAKNKNAKSKNAKNSNAKKSAARAKLSVS